MSKPPSSAKPTRRILCERLAVSTVLSALVGGVAAGGVDFAWAASHGRWWPGIWLQGAGMALPWGAVGGLGTGLWPRRAGVVAALLGVVRTVYMEARAWHLGWSRSVPSVLAGLAVSASIALSIWLVSRFLQPLASKRGQQRMAIP